MGFAALATTSAGLAWSLGRPDTQVTLEEALEHLRAVAAAVRVPVNADFEGGYAVEPAGGRGERRTGGGDRASPGCRSRTRRATTPTRSSSSSWRSNGSGPRVEAIDASGTGVVLTGRSEGFVRGRPDIDETVRRLKAYADAGADCVYAPRIERTDHVTAIVEAVAPTPVNLLSTPRSPPSPTRRGSGCAGSASEAPSPALRGPASSMRPRRSRTRERSRGSRACRTSTHCWAAEPAPDHA